LTDFRLNVGLLVQGERGALNWLARAVPGAVDYGHPAWLELGGAGLMGAGFLACHWSNWMLGVVLFGLFVNWVGDAALFQHTPLAPRHGYFVDHSTDLIAQTLVVIGLGLSPYFTICSALLVLSILLLMNSYSYLRFMVIGEEPLFGGVETVSQFCLFAALWGLFAASVGPALTQTRIFGREGLDVLVGSLWLVLFASFLFRVRRDLARIEEDPAPRRRA